MTTASTDSTSSSSSHESPPSQWAILFTYIVLGGGLSFLVGREPGTLPDNLAVELAPATLVVCIFLTYYDLWDCMAAGQAKQKHGLKQKEDSIIPEPVYLAQRVQTNQVEQMPVFIVGMMACAIFVNGWTAAILGLLWTLLRIRYAFVYRGCVGLPYDQTMKRIGSYTIPAYFLCNAMLVAAGIHSLRALLNEGV